MKKLHVLGVVLAAVFAFGALTAASASATVVFLLAEWLKGGVAVTTTELVDSEAGPNGVTLRETVLFIKIAVNCSGIFDGSIGPNGADEITELLTLGEGAIPTTPLVEPGLVCTNVENCPEPLVWLDNLPWLTLAELMEEGTESFFVDLILPTVVGNNPGYHVDCMNGTNDLCTAAEAITQLTNEANGTVDGVFSESFTELAGLKLANCETAGNEQGIVEGLGFTLLTGGGSLSISSGP
jgi:hypothetical protein